MNVAVSTERKPVHIWFAVFALAAFAMPAMVALTGIENRTIAAALVASPLLLLAKGAANAIANSRTSTHPDGGAQARYVIRMLVITAFYIASLFAALMLVGRDDPLSASTVILAALPGIAVGAYFWAIGRLITEMTDEFHKTLLVRQSLIATGIKMAAASLYGFLENFGVTEHLDAFWWPIIWFAGFGIGAIANKVQFGTTGEIE